MSQFNKYQNPFWNGGDHSDYLVFNKGKFIGQLTMELFNTMVNPHGPSAPRGGTPYGDFEYAFIYNKKPIIPQGSYANKRWWRVDGTPVISGDVPKEYIAMAALIS